MNFPTAENAKREQCGRVRGAVVPGGLILGSLEGGATFDPAVMCRVTHTQKPEKRVYFCLSDVFTLCGDLTEAYSERLMS